MRIRDTAFSLVILIALLAALWVTVLQNPQSAQWTFLGQTFSLAAGVAVAGAALIGFLLAVLFVLPLVGAAGATATATTASTTAAATSASERDVLQLREQYRQLQAEHSRLQSYYNQLVAERARPQAQPAAAAPVASTASTYTPPAPTPMAQPNPNAPEMARTRVWGVSDQPGDTQPGTAALTGSTAPSDSGDPNTRIAMPLLPPDEMTETERPAPPLPQLPVLTDAAVPQAEVQPPFSVSSSDDPDRTAPAAYAPTDTRAPTDAVMPTVTPTDTRADLPPGRQVIRPDGSILAGNDAPPPPTESPDTTANY